MCGIKYIKVQPTTYLLQYRGGKKTLAFPAISCGVYGYPIPDAVRIAVRETRAALKSIEEPERVVFACFTEEVFAAYQRAVSEETK